MADRTLGDVKARVSVLLQDVAEVRYSDAELTNAVNDAVLEVRRIRPDLFLSSDFVVTDMTADTEVIPVPDFFFNSLVYIVSGHAMLRDDQFSVDSRAVSLLNKGLMQLQSTGA